MASNQRPLRERVRSHSGWGAYAKALEAGDLATAAGLALVIATELGLTAADRHRLPQIGRRSTRTGRPPKPHTRCVTCPHCSGAFEVAG